MRYAANLLFQYGIDGRPAARPLCEKRIVVVTARSAKDALERATALGRKAQLSYRNAEGQRFRVRFLGLVDLIELFGDAREVYYSMFRTSRPLKHVRRREQLWVFRSGPKTIQSAWWAVPAEIAGTRRPRPAARTRPLPRVLRRRRARGRG